MASTTAYSGRGQTVQNDTDPSFSKLIRPSYLRSPPFSSSTSESSFGSFSFHNDSPLSPTTPLRFSGIPFSWEHLPGIPKQQLPKKKDPSLNLLPLPPIPSKKQHNREETSPLIRKKFTSERIRSDPFLAAFVECSKDDHEDTIGIMFWKDSKVTRTWSDRFGFIDIHASCRRTCAVSESIVYFPKSRKHHLFKHCSS